MQAEFGHLFCPFLATPATFAVLDGMESTRLAPRTIGRWTQVVSSTAASG